MPERFNSIKYKLLTGFLVLTLNTVFLSSFSFYYFKRAEKIRILNGAIYRLHIQVLQLIKLDNELLNFGVINNDFYQNGSKVLIKRNNLKSQIRQKKYLIKQEVRNENFDLEEDLQKLESSLNKYHETYEIIILKIRERGFKDYGLEGVLRGYAHALERDPSLKQELIITLRKHEKDFFLRNDVIYSFRLDSICDSILKELGRSKRENVKKIELINNYRHSFRKLSKVQEEIGFYNNRGLKQKLNILNGSINAAFDKISNYSNNRVETIIEYGTSIYILTVIFSITLSLLISYLIASRLSRPIRKLSGMMDKFVLSKIKEQKRVENKLAGLKKTEIKSRGKKLRNLLQSKDLNYSNEIKTLCDSFINLIQHTKEQFNEIQIKSQLLKSQNEELKKINVELDHFVYSAAHDLRSPLTSLLGLIELLNIENNSAMTNVYLSHMRKSINKLDSFIKDIVDYSKNNRLEIQIEEINMQEILDNCFEIQQFIPGTEKLRRIVEMDINAPFLSDKRRITIILNNFISNGLRYFDPTKENPFIGIFLSINEDEAQLIIEDNGIGIEECEIENVFKMFYRASEASKGSGLGLFIVKEAINKLNGNIKVNSQAGLGTKFIIHLPNHYRSRNLSIER